MATQDMPFVTMLTAEEITQAILNRTVEKDLCLDPARHDISYRVSYRQAKVNGVDSLFASITITSVEPKAEAKATGQ